MYAKVFSMKILFYHIEQAARIFLQCVIKNSPLCNIFHGEIKNGILSSKSDVQN